MTDENADKAENAKPTPEQTPAQTPEAPAGLPPPVDEARAAETPAADVAPVAGARTEEPVAAEEPPAEEPPPLPATPAPPPAGELVATAERREEVAATHAAPPLEQPPPEETPTGAIPPDEAAAAETAPEPVAEAEPEPEPAPVAEQEGVPGEPAPTPEPAAEAEPEPEPAEPAQKPKKPRKSKAAAAVTPAEPAPAPEAAEPAVAVTEPPPESKKKWYAVKVQSGREESIKAAIERKVKIEGLEEYFGQIVIPVEEVIVKKKVKVKNKKTGETTTQEKNVTKHNKKFPGYLFAEVEFNDEILYVFRETSGVGDFVGMTTKRTAGGTSRQPPPPMTEDEVKSMLTGIPAPGGPRKGKGGKVVVKLDFEKGDKVRIRNGAFTGSEGEVKSITEPKDPTETPKITVEVTLWGRPVPVEVDYWEVDKV